MADYLAGLAARAIGVETVVRPRPARRFEMQPPEEPKVVRAAGPVREAEPSGAVEQVPPVAATEQEPRESAPPPATAADQPPSELSSGHAPPRPIASGVVPTVGRVEPSVLATSAPQPVARPPTPGAARHEAIEHRVATPVRPTTRRRTAEPAAARQASSEPPPVRVTIGRIEVRAVTPPAQAPPRSEPRRSPPLSLDEYLEQRRSRRR